MTSLTCERKDSFDKAESFDLPVGASWTKIDLNTPGSPGIHFREEIQLQEEVIYDAACGCSRTNVLLFFIE
jgi:hypothetical protein